LILPQLLILLTICLPAFILADFSKGQISSAKSFNVGIYYILYFLIPVLSMLALFRIHKIDLYEIFYKFWPIYSLMLVEFLLVFGAVFFGKGVNIEILTSRIPLFFLHFYYYLPIIFYGSREYYSFYVGRDGGDVINAIRKIIFVIFNRLNYLYLPLIIVLIIIFAIQSSVHFNLI
jgi:hypothetical protein